GHAARLPRPRTALQPRWHPAARTCSGAAFAPDLEARRFSERNPDRWHRVGLLMAIPHPRDVQLAVVNWLDERYPFTKASDEAMYQRVPNFANAFYYCFGGMVFILIVFQLLTGVF